MAEYHEAFGLNLILAEEQQEVVARSPPESGGQSDHQGETKRTLVVDDSDVYIDGTYYVVPDSDDVGWMVPGPGSLDTLLLVGDKGDFSVTIQTAEATLLSDDYATLEGISSELSHVAAYESSSGNKVLSVSGFPYHQRLSVEVHANDVTFTRVRGVFTVGSV